MYIIMLPDNVVEVVNRQMAKYHLHHLFSMARPSLVRLFSTILAALAKKQVLFNFNFSKLSQE